MSNIDNIINAEEELASKRKEWLALPYGNAKEKAKREYNSFLNEVTKLRIDFYKAGIRIFKP